MMNTILNSVLTAMHDLLGYMRDTPIASWGGYSVSLYSAAVSLLVYERVLAVIFAAISRFSSGGGEDD